MPVIDSRTNQRNETALQNHECLSTQREWRGLRIRKQASGRDDDMDARTVDIYDRDASTFANDWHGQPAPDDMYHLAQKYFRAGRNNGHRLRKRA